MYIKKLHIEEFGPLENVIVEDLPQSMAVFLGDNEAGKSSSMEFIRTMLTGIPNRRDLFYQSMKKFKGGTMLIDDEQYGAMLLERKFSARSNRNLKVFNEKGERVENEQYFQLIDHISQDIYRLIFGFNLSELQNFSAFQDNTIFENILGASYGLGLNSPDFALQKLQNEMDTLYKQKGKNSVLHNLFVRWKEEFDLAEEARHRVKKFDELQAKLVSAKESHKELVQEKENVAEYKKEVTKLLTLWNQWKKWADLQKEFVRMNIFSRSAFSAYEGGAEVLFAKIMEQRRLKKEYLLALMQEQHDFEIQINRFKIDNAIVEHYQDIHDLSIISLDFQKLITEVPNLEVQIEQAKYALETQNAKCIDKWISFDKKNNFAHNFTAEESITYFKKLFENTDFFEKWAMFEVQIREVKAQVQNAKTALEYAKRDVEKAEQKYKAVCTEKGKLLNNSSFVGNENATSEESYQNWHNFLQENKQKERDLLELSATKCTEFLNNVNALGFSSEKLKKVKKNITKDNIEDYIAEYVQLAQVVREMYSAKDWLQEKAKAFLEKYAEMTAFLQQAETEKDVLENKEKQEQTNKEKIYALEKKCTENIQQIEQLIQTKNQEQNEKQDDTLTKWAYIPAYLCGGSGAILLATRLIHEDSIAETFLGNLHIPFFLPIALLILGIGQAIMLHFYSKKEPIEKEFSTSDDEVTNLLNKLNELQNIEENLLHGFFPNEPIEIAKQQTVSTENNSPLGFGDTLSEKIEEQKKSPLLQLLEKAKEKQQIFTHYANLIAEPQIQEVDTKTKEQIEAMDREVTSLEQELLAFFEKYHCVAPSFETIPHFVQELEQLDLFVQEINTITYSIRKCYDNYQQFVDWTKDNLPKLYKEIKNVISDEYLMHFNDFRNQQKQEQFKQIEEEHGAIFADSLASLEESKNHYQSVIDTVQERQENVKKVYMQCADFLVQETLLQEKSYQDFVNNLCKEENEQDILSGEFAKVKALVDALFYLHTLFMEQEKKKEDVVSLKAKAKDFIDPLRAILMRIEYAPKTPIKVDADYLYIYKELLVHAEQEMEKVTRRDLIIQEFNKVKDQYQKGLQEVQSIESTLLELYKAAGVKNEQELMALFVQLKETERYIQQAIAIEESFQDIEIPRYAKKSTAPCKREYEELENQKPLPQIFQYFDEQAKIRFEQTLAELQEEEEGLIAIEKHIRELEIKVEAESNFVYEESLSNEASFRMKKIEDEIKDNYNKWLELSFTKEILLRAKKQYEDTSQPLIVKIASDFFTQITDDKWKEIRVSLEDKNVLVADENNNLVNAEMLSQGTREQLYLSLRLAHITHRANTKRALPILMDDILVNFDERRVRNTAKLLNTMVTTKEDSNNKQQIFFYTCHESTAKIIEEIVAGTKIYQVQNKQVFAL